MKTDSKTGFIITYFHTSEEGLKLLKENIKTLSREDYYLVLASHSPIDKDLQELCDFSFFQSKNIVDDRKYSHGVAESQLIEISLKHLQSQNIHWTYKASYDIEINDVNQFKKWRVPGKEFVSCIWGNNILCTNSFFANVDFILNNITFYQTIDEMFSVNTVLENCWENDIRQKNLEDRIFAFSGKDELYGENKIDRLFYDYAQIDFWFDSNENKFWLRNNGETIESAEFRIFDYFTDICISKHENYNLSKGVLFWFIPACNFYLSTAKNGFYLEIYNKDLVIRKNIHIKDFDYKHKLSGSFRKIKKTEAKFDEYCHFQPGGQWSDFNISNNIRNFLDIGANYGFSSVNFIEGGIKTYLVEPDPNNLSIVNLMWSKNSNIKIIDKAITHNNGEVDFWIRPGQHSVTSNCFKKPDDDDLIRVSVKSITPNELIENYIDEDYIDLVKIDIEGSEWELFESISDYNLNKCKEIILEWHHNENYRIMNILKKLTSNGFRFVLKKSNENDYPIENSAGFLHAYKSLN